MAIRRLLYYVICFVATMTLLSGCRSKRAATTTAPDITTVPVQTMPGTTPTDSGGIQSHQKRLVDEAMTWLGTPYRYGGQDKSGADCSGLTMQVYKNALGILLPRNSGQQQKYCNKISYGQIQVGDLIFFTTGRDKARVSHVGMYVGNGYFIHASGSRGVILSQLGESYYTRNYHSTGHVPGLDKFEKGKKAPAGKVPEIRFDRIPPAGKLETEPLRFDLDKEIEQKIDSVLSGFLD